MSTRDELREHLAAIEHERWGDWQRWMHGLCVKRANGDLIIPRDCVERWERQINTSYSELSEKEKQSDRDQVDRYWPLIEPLLAAPPAPGEVTGGADVTVALTRDDLALVAYGLRSATRSEQNVATFSALRRLADTFALAAHAAAPEES